MLKSISLKEKVDVLFGVPEQVCLSNNACFAFGMCLVQNLAKIYPVFIEVFVFFSPVRY